MGTLRTRLRHPPKGESAKEEEIHQRRLRFRPKRPQTPPERPNHRVLRPFHRLFRVSTHIAICTAASHTSFEVLLVCEDVHSGATARRADVNQVFQLRVMLEHPLSTVIEGPGQTGCFCLCSLHSRDRETWLTLDFEALLREAAPNSLN